MRQKLTPEEKKIRERERSRKWYVENKERHRASVKKYWEKNKKRLYDKNVEWKERNRDKVRAYGRDWARKNPIKNLKTRLRITFGITLERFEEMLRSQNGLCAICFLPSKNKRLAVDHCHRTKKVRALLCDPCNRAIGLFKEDPIRMANAIEYLKKHAISGDNRDKEDNGDVKED